MRLALLLLVSCATPVLPPAGESTEDAWKRSRMIEAALNGCSVPCPADKLCVDDYGLCWEPCAWQRSTPAERESMHRAAMDTDPTSTFLMHCPQPRGTVEASR